MAKWDKVKVEHDTVILPSRCCMAAMTWARSWLARSWPNLSCASRSASRSWLRRSWLRRSWFTRSIGFPCAAMWLTMASWLPLASRPLPEPLRPRTGLGTRSITWECDQWTCSDNYNTQMEELYIRGSIPCTIQSGVNLNSPNVKRGISTFPILCFLLHNMKILRKTNIATWYFTYKIAVQKQKNKISLLMRKHTISTWVSFNLHNRPNNTSQRSK